MDNDSNGVYKEVQRRTFKTDIIDVASEIKNGMLTKVEGVSFPPASGSVGLVDESNNTLYITTPKTTTLETTNFEKIAETDFYWNSKQDKSVLIYCHGDKCDFYKEDYKTSSADYGPILGVHSYGPDDFVFKYQANCIDTRGKLIHYRSWEKMSKEAKKINQEFENDRRTLEEQIKETKLYVPFESQSNIWQSVSNKENILVINDNKGYFFEKLVSADFQKKLS